jgi:hypothetical protein
MNKLITLAFLCFASFQSYGQMVMSAEGVKAEKACQPSTIYFLMEKRARPIEAIDSIEVKLNRQVNFARENPNFQGKPSIQFAVNCNGEIGGGFHVVIKSGNEKLDNELIEFFKSVKEWKAGMIKKKTVDSWYMWRLEIKNGFIDIIN